jgi:hypothetical protein
MSDSPLKDQLLDAVLHEIRICKHLHSRLPAGMDGFKPSEPQRTTIELLRYIATCAEVSIEVALTREPKRAEEILARVAAMPSADFPAEMDRQAEYMRRRFAAWTDADLVSRIVWTPPGGEMPLFKALITTVLGFLTAYRMQLFLYARQNGADVGTVDNWVGLTLDEWRAQREAAGGA